MFNRCNFGQIRNEITVYHEMCVTNADSNERGQHYLLEPTFKTSATEVVKAAYHKFSNKRSINMRFGYTSKLKGAYNHSKQPALATSNTAPVLEQKTNETNCKSTIFHLHH